MKVSLALLLLDRVFLSLYLNEALSYEGILIGPELVHNVLVFSQDVGKVPGKGNQMFLVFQEGKLVNWSTMSYLRENTQTLFLQVP